MCFHNTSETICGQSFRHLMEPRSRWTVGGHCIRVIQDHIISNRIVQVSIRHSFKHLLKAMFILQQGEEVESLMAPKVIKLLERRIRVMLDAGIIKRPRIHSTVKQTYRDDVDNFLGQSHWIKDWSAEAGLVYARGRGGEHKGAGACGGQVYNIAANTTTTIHGNMEKGHIGGGMNGVNVDFSNAFHMPRRALPPVQECEVNDAVFAGGLAVIDHEEDDSEHDIVSLGDDLSDDGSYSSQHAIFRVDKVDDMELVNLPDLVVNHNHQHQHQHEHQHRWRTSSREPFLKGPSTKAPSTIFSTSPPNSFPTPPSTISNHSSVCPWDSISNMQPETQEVFPSYEHGPASLRREIRTLSLPELYETIDIVMHQLIGFVARLRAEEAKMASVEVLAELKERVKERHGVGRMVKEAIEEKVGFERDDVLAMGRLWWWVLV
ncbi:hypothetical protein ACHAPU_010203 [Fusarium lateritium]